MSDNEEWGEWQTHDGKGQPVPDGTIVLGNLACGAVREWVVGEGSMTPDGQLSMRPAVRRSSIWEWALPGNDVPAAVAVIRYRIRKPRALLDLIERARELDDAPEGPVRTPARVSS